MFQDDIDREGIVEEINPLKQGLKRHFASSRQFCYIVEEINPLKKGLKPLTFVNVKPSISSKR